MLLHAMPTTHSNNALTTHNIKNIEVNVGWSTTHITTAVTKTNRRKSVHFADAKGLALVSTYFFVSERKSLCEQQERYRRQLYKPTEERTILLNFKSPIPSKEFEENLSTNNVSLERTYCNKNGIYGRVQVKNIAFEKEVTVRYSFNAWDTILEQRASYIPGASIATMDTFFFHIPPPLIRQFNEEKLEFAISYKVNGQNFWDNNFGDNYRLIYSSQR